MFEVAGYRSQCNTAGSNCGSGMNMDTVWKLASTKKCKTFHRNINGFLEVTIHKLFVFSIFLVSMTKNWASLRYNVYNYTLFISYLVYVYVIQDFWKNLKRRTT
jgi:hypothetical protein